MNKNELKEKYQIKKQKIKSKLNQFKLIPEDKWIQEFIFCTLTPQSNAKKCWQAVKEIIMLKNKNEKPIKNILKSKTRFHNNKTKYLLNNFNSWNEIKSKIKQEKTDIKKLRNWISNNVKGYGLKESSHFLRNIGLSDNKVAILDRHILKNLKILNVIKEEKIKNKKDYLEKEQKFLNFSKYLKIPIDELDLLFWSNENGEVFK